MKSPGQDDGTSPEKLDKEAGPDPESGGLDFVRRIVVDDLQTGKWAGRVATRFPP